MNIKDIAAAANVSVSTVSKVLNHKDHDISDATKKRVLSVIKENNYSPYSNIKETSLLNNFLTALMIDPSLISESFLSPLEKYLAKDGYGLMLCPLSAQEDSIKKQLRILHAKHVDGIMLFSYSQDLSGLLAENNSYHIPVVCLLPKPAAAYPTICCDPADLSRLAVRILSQKGHTRIGCLIDSATTDADAAKNGYLNALFEQSISQNSSFIIDGAYPFDIYEQLNVLFDNDITAIYCQNNQLAAAACSFFYKKNISVPDRISIVTGEPASSGPQVHYPLCSVGFLWDDVCKKAAAMLIAQIESKNCPVENIHIQPHIWRQDHISAPASNIVKILVVGNITMDTIISTDHLPEAGDLITAQNILTAPGGKGVNQAVASANLGGDVTILGRVGDDIEGHAIIDMLHESNIKTDGIYIDTMCSTGKTFINSTHVEHSAVVAYPGANLHFDMAQIRECTHAFHETDICLLSTEIPADVISFIINYCYERNIKIFLKPSLNTKIEPSLLDKIDYLIPNCQELDQLVPGSGSFYEKADQLFQCCQNTIIVTLGERGCYVRNQELNQTFPAAGFSPVDTTGAANCFIGALAVSLSKGNTLPYSICYATYAAGYSVSQAGIQTSFPTRKQLTVYKDDIHAMYIDYLERKEQDSVPAISDGRS